jgi:hypothetical protein
MWRGLFLLILGAGAVTALAGGQIREFGISTLERLGNELYYRDQIAAQSSELLLKTKPIVRSLKIRGWITDLQKEGKSVYWIADTPSGPSLAYKVTYRGLTDPDVEDVRGQPLPPAVAVRYKARQTAVDALKGKLYDIEYNFEVLDDPDRSGFLVYAIGATNKSDEVVLGGHFRVTVSADGDKAERVDALSKSLLINKEGEGLPPDAHQVGMAVTQLISDKPVETLVYTSRVTGQPIAVVTSPNGQIWYIENGKITHEKSGRAIRRKR